MTGVAVPCPLCGHHTLFVPTSPTYPVSSVVNGVAVGCCNPMCAANDEDEDDDYEDDDD